jgi:hypothetical protein
MGNPHLKLVIPAAEKRTVMTRRGEEQRAAHARVAVKSRRASRSGVAYRGSGQAEDFLLRMVKSIYSEPDKWQDADPTAMFKNCRLALD